MDWLVVFQFGDWSLKSLRKDRLTGLRFFVVPVAPVDTITFQR